MRQERQRDTEIETEKEGEIQADRDRQRQIVTEDTDARTEIEERHTDREGTWQIVKHTGRHRDKQPAVQGRLTD